MTRVDLDAIEKRAREATPGPWWVDEEGAICTSGVKVPLDLRPIVVDAAYYNVLDADHIAGMDPATVLALVAELRAAREAYSKLADFHDNYDSGSDDRFKVRGQIFRILTEWDRAVGS